MEVSSIITEIDAQIAKLQQARALLSGTPAPSSKPGRGRPKGSKNAPKVEQAAAPANRKSGPRKLTPEGRKAIAEAMKRRWAERRKQLAN